MNPPPSSDPAQAALYTEQRPWGSFTVLVDSPVYKAKTIEVLPGQRLSLQLHHKREEHWIVTEGELDVTVGEEIRRCKAGDYIYIPVETKHRVANTGSNPAQFVEVQLGQYFGEDDIVRFEDDYNRT